MFPPFLLVSTCCPRIARVASSEELGTMSENNLRRMTLVSGPIWEIHSLTLILSWYWQLVDSIIFSFTLFLVWFFEWGETRNVLVGFMWAKIILSLKREFFRSLYTRTILSFIRFRRSILRVLHEARSPAVDERTRSIRGLYIQLLF